MNMRSWKPIQFYCYRCGQWYGNLQHGYCPLGQFGSLVWIDIENFELGCNKCNRTWPPEGSINYCSYGHAQPIQYTDSVVVLEEGDQEIATDGNMVYVLTRSGTVVVGLRNYLDIG